MIIKKKALLIYIGLAIFIVGQQLPRINIEVPSIVFRLVQLTGVIELLFVHLFIEKKIRTKLLLLFAFALVILLLDAIPSRLTELLFLAAIIWSIQKQDVKAIYKWCLIFTTVTVVIIYLLGVGGIIKAENVIQNYRIRFNYGFSSYSILPFQLLALVYGYCYFRKKISIIETILFSFIGYMIYRRTDLKTAFYLLVAFLVCAYFIGKKSKWNLEKLQILKYLPFILALISVAGVIAFGRNNQNITALDLVIGSRFKFAVAAIQRYGIHLFSSYIDWDLANKTSYLIVDNSYINILLTYGVIGLAFVLCVYSYVLSYSVKENEPLLLIGVIITLFNGLLWSRLIVFTEVEFLIFATTYFDKRRRTNIKCIP